MKRPDQYSPEARAAFDAEQKFTQQVQQESQNRLMRGEASKDVFALYDRQRRTVAEEYLLAQTAQNKKDLEERNPVDRQKRQVEWRETAADPDKARAFLLRTAMFKSVERAESIT